MYLGASSFSSDEMVNDIYNKDNDFFLKIKSLYPQTIEKGRFNKKYLSSFAFRNEKVLNNLEQIIHPKLTKRREKAAK